ncbi:MAG: zinc-binding dehydrogenase [Brevefilum sp.]|nr:zinc-binding dehydrogenase [Brevefilum sp.]
MKAIRLYGINDLRIDDVPPPIPQANEVLLQTKSVGVCGSDVHYFHEGGTGSVQLVRPLILGHEFSAIIASGPDQGTLVAVDPALNCGVCEFCKEGNPNFCVNLKFAGSEDTDGAMQTFLAWPRTAIYPLPSSMTPDEGAMLEPLGIAIHALRLGKVFPGMDVGVFGTGPIGLLTIMMAKIAGAGRIFATDRLTDRLKMAKDCGATHVFQADGHEVDPILSATGNRGLDVTFETAGDDGSAVETAIQTAKRGGTAVLVGIPSEDITQFTASAARRRGLTIKLSRRMKNTYPLSIRLVSTGQINLKPLITHTFPLEAYQQAFQTAADRQGIKVLINFPGASS